MNDGPGSRPSADGDFPPKTIIASSDPHPGAGDTVTLYPLDTGDPNSIDDTEGHSFGEFELHREVGRGGMGIVYEASEARLSRRVAVKVLPPTAWKDETREKRFLNESRAAAQLNHENIVPIYAVGRTEDAHYFVMKLIDGRNLSQIVRQIRRELSREAPDTAPAGLQETLPKPQADPRRPDRGKSDRQGDDHSARLNLSADDFVPRRNRRRYSATRRLADTVAQIGATVAHALQHAHEAGIIHRDIKPSNLLLDNDGKVWVTDFGLAMIRDAPSITQTGVLLGTLRYMSPEQAAGKRAFVDHRTDIYSLGVTLFELLTLQPMIEGEGTELILKKVALGAAPALRRIDSAIPEELTVILQKALSRDPADRYATAGEMADDLDRYLRREPIRARRPGLMRRTRYWLEQHRVLATSMAVIMVCLFFTSVVTAGLVWEAFLFEQQQREQTEAALDESEGLRLLANASLQLSADPGLALTLAARGSRAAPGAEANSAVLAASDACHEYSQYFFQEGAPSLVTWSPAGTHVLVGTRPRIDGTPAPLTVHDALTGRIVRRIVAGHVDSAAFSPSGQYLLTVSGEASTTGCRFSVWNTQTGQHLKSFDNCAALAADPSLFHPREDRLLIPGSNEVVLYDLRLFRRTLTLRQFAGQILQLSFSPDGELILTVTDDAQLTVWSADSGTPTRPAIDCHVPRARPMVAEFTADSKTVVLCDQLGTRSFSALADSDHADATHRRSGERLVCSRSHMLLASVHHNSLEVLSSRNLERLRDISVAERIVNVQFLPEEPVVAVRCADVVYLFEALTARKVGELRGHEKRLTALAAAHDRLATISADHSLRLWHRRSGQDRRTYETARPEWDQLYPFPLAASPDDSLVAVGSQFTEINYVLSRDGSILPGAITGMPVQGSCQLTNFLTIQGRTISVQDQTSGRELHRSVYYENKDDTDIEPIFATMGPHGRFIAVDAGPGETWLIDLENNERQRLTLGGQGFRLRAFSASGDYLYAARQDGLLVQYETSTAAPVKIIQHPRRLSSLQAVPGTDHVVLMDTSNEVLYWNPGEGDPQQIPNLTAGRSVTTLHVIDNGRLLLTWNQTAADAVQCHDLKTGTLVDSVEPTGRPYVIADAARDVVCVASDKSLVLWHPAKQSATTLHFDGRVQSGSLMADEVVVLTEDSQQPTTALHFCRLNEDPSVVRQQTLPFRARRVRWDGDSERLVVTERQYRSHIFDAQSRRYRYAAPGLHRKPLWLRFSKRHGHLLSVSSEGQLRFTNSNGDPLVNEYLQIGRITDVHLDQSGELLLVGSSDGRSVLWSVGAESPVAELDPLDSAVRLLRIGPQRKSAVVLGSDGECRIYQLSDQSFVTHDIPHAESALFSSSGRRLVVLTRDRTARVRQAWLLDIVSGDLRQIPELLDCVDAAWSHTGDHLLLLETQGTLSELNPENLQIIRQFDRVADSGHRMAVSPNDEFLLVRHSATTSSVMDFATGRLVYQLQHMPMAPGLPGEWRPFSSDGRWFYMIGTDRQPQRWPSSPTRLLDQLHVRPFTEPERRRFRLATRINGTALLPDSFPLQRRTTSTD